MDTYNSIGENNTVPSENHNTSTSFTSTNDKHIPAYKNNSGGSNNNKTTKPRIK